MGAIIFNIAKGKFARYAALPETNDAMIAVVLKSSGLESDATLKDYDDLSVILAAANDEATFTGYSRYTLSGVTVTVDDTNDWVLVDCNDPSWSPTSAEAIGAILFVYDNDTTSGTDSAILPIFKDDFALTTPTSGTVTYQVASGGFGKAS
jgi:hypothetical protein